MAVQVIPNTKLQLLKFFIHLKFYIFNILSFIQHANTLEKVSGIPGTVLHIKHTISDLFFFLQVIC